MNRVVLIGRLTRNPEIRYSQNENSIAVARFTLAVDRRFKRDNEATADFIGCVAFGRTAEFFEKYTRQGSKMAIEGRIQTGSYVKQDGSKVYTTDVVVENAEFADSRPQGQGQQQGGFQQGQGYQGQPYQQPQYSQNPGFGNQGYQSQGNGLGSYQSQGVVSGYEQQSPAPAGYQDQGYSAPSGFSQEPAPMQEAADEGFMQIPDELNDEGLPSG